MVRNYCDLPVEGSWIANLRARLPYGFLNIREVKPKDRPRYFQLSEPTLLTGMEASEHHNFWRRGNVYYMTGKLMDYFSMSEAGRLYRQLEVLRLLSGHTTVRVPWPMNPLAFYNSMQMEKVWGFVQGNHLDRERVMMTNVMLAIELCLKAVMTHANFHEFSRFEFRSGHHIVKLFEGLPNSLQEELVAESRAFAADYASFRVQVETDVREIHERSHKQLPGPAPTEKQARAEWDEITDRIRQSHYTAFVNSNDPGARISEDWFEESLKRIDSVRDPHDISQYFRYAPAKDKDELPTDLIEQVLMLGRFLYEHLFPLPPPDDLPSSGFSN